MRSTAVRIGLLLAAVFLTPVGVDGGGPIEPHPREAPGGFIFSPAPAAVSIYRDTLMIATIIKGDTTGAWIELDEETVLVTFADPDIPNLKIGIYEYRLLGHYGRYRRGPYEDSKEKRSAQPEATLTVLKGKMCIERAGYRSCKKTD